MCLNCSEDILVLCGKSNKFCSRRCASQFAAKQPRKKPSEEVKQKRIASIKKACEQFIGLTGNCKICGKEYSIKGLPSHIWRSHGEGQNHKPDLKKPFLNGRVIWNKGLSRETSKIVDQISKSVSKTIKEKIKNGTHIIVPMGPEARKRLSIAQSLHNRGGRSKWFKVGGRKVQGTWERDLACKFEKFSIVWNKLKTSKDVFIYISDGQEKAYTPDFYLEKYDRYIEIKGHWWGNDKEKMRIVFDTYPDLKSKTIIIEKDKYKKLLAKENKEDFLMVLWQ